MEWASNSSGQELRARGALCWHAARGTVLGAASLACGLVSLVAMLAVDSWHQAPSTRARWSSVGDELTDPVSGPLLFIVTGLVSSIGFAFACPLLVGTRLRLSIPIVALATVGATTAASIPEHGAPVLAGLLAGLGSMFFCWLVLPRAERPRANEV